MKATPSLLKLHDYSLMDFKCKCILKEPTSDIKALFDQYLIDIDFGIQQIKSSNMFVVFLKLNINNDKDVHAGNGYAIYAEGMGVFEVDSPDKSVWYNSAVSMSISYIRANIANITASFALGKYTLPSIDMKAVTERKSIKPARLKSAVKKK